METDGKGFDSGWKRVRFGRRGAKARTEPLDVGLAADRVDLDQELKVVVLPADGGRGREPAARAGGKGSGGRGGGEQPARGAAGSVDATAVMAVLVVLVVLVVVVADGEVVRGEEAHRGARAVLPVEDAHRLRAAEAGHQRCGSVRALEAHNGSHEGGLVGLGVDNLGDALLVARPLLGPDGDGCDERARRGHVHPLVPEVGDEPPKSGVLAAALMRLRAALGCGEREEVLLLLVVVLLLPHDRCLAAQRRVLLLEALAALLRLLEPLLEHQRPRRRREERRGLLLLIGCGRGSRWWLGGIGGAAARRVRRREGKVVVSAEGSATDREALRVRPPADREALRVQPECGHAERPWVLVVVVGELADRRGVADAGRRWLSVGRGREKARATRRARRLGTREWRGRRVCLVQAERRASAGEKPVG
jgi:hypothetical protein